MVEPAPKLDGKRTIPGYTARRGAFDELVVPAMDFLMIDGEGDPNATALYTDSLASLYPLAYALKALSKRELGRDFGMMPLEGRWWADDLAAFTRARDKSRWRWTLMIMTPDWLGREHIEAARTAIARKGAAPRLEAVRHERLDVGLALQTLHIGPYDDEGPVIERMHGVAAERGLRLTGRHHEIYLGDPRRSAPERLRTILRQPVAR